MTLYHSTKAKYLKKILKEGLLVSHPRLRESKPKGVYLSKSPFHWMHHATWSGDFQGLMLEIDTKGLSLKPDFHTDKRDEHLEAKGDVFCTCNIPPENIKSIWIESSPNTFTELKE